MISLLAATYKYFSVPITYARRYAYQERHKYAKYNVLQAVPALVTSDAECGILVCYEEAPALKAAPILSYLKINEIMERFNGL